MEVSTDDVKHKKREGGEEQERQLNSVLHGTHHCVPETVRNGSCLLKCSRRTRLVSSAVESTPASIAVAVVVTAVARPALAVPITSAVAIAKGATTVVSRTRSVTVEPSAAAASTTSLVASTETSVATVSSATLVLAEQVDRAEGSYILLSN